MASAGLAVKVTMDITFFSYSFSETNKQYLPLDPELRREIDKTYYLAKFLGNLAGCFPSLPITCLQHLSIKLKGIDITLLPNNLPRIHMSFCN